MEAGLVNPVFWLAMTVALAVAAPMNTRCTTSTH